MEIHVQLFGILCIKKSIDILHLFRYSITVFKVKLRNVKTGNKWKASGKYIT